MVMPLSSRTAVPSCMCIDRHAADVADTGALDEPQELLPGFRAEPLLLRNVLRCNQSHRDTAASQRCRRLAADEPGADYDRGLGVRTRCTQSLGIRERTQLQCLFAAGDRKW